MSLLGKDGPFPFEEEQSYSQAVFSVEYVGLTMLVLNGPRIVLITAYGTTVTPGWSDARLQPFVYIQPPPDGIWDFVLVAEPPTKSVREVLSHIAATYVWTLGKSEFMGVRIHSSTNTLEKHKEGVAETILQMKYRIGEKAA
jgi:hypothetical protein